MLRIIEEPKEERQRIVTMYDMEPLQVGYSLVNGVRDQLVIKTASEGEVISLSRPKTFWKPPLKTTNVELLPPGESITIELFNEE